jgi:hypothetical protein
MSEVAMSFQLRARRSIWLLCALTAFTACGSREEQAQVIALQAFAIDRAALLEEQDLRTAAVRVVSANGRLEWRRALPKGARAEHVHVQGDAIVVSYARATSRDRFEHTVTAFSTERGAALWTRVLATTSTEHGFTAPLASDATRLVAYHLNELEQSSASAVRMSDGQILWTKPLRGDRLVTPALGPGFLVAHGLADPGLSTLDLQTGSQGSYHTLGIGCFVQGKYLTLRELEDTKIVALDSANTARVVAPFRPLPNSLVYKLASCGSFKGRLAFLVDTPQAAGSSDRSTHLILTDGSGRNVSTIPLGEDTHWPGDRPRAIESMPLGGEMTRFVPYVSVTYEAGGTAARMLVLDLETGTIATKGKVNETLMQYRLFRKGELWFLSRREDIVVFDGTSGKLTAAVRIKRPATVAKLEPSHVANDKLWIYRTDRSGGPAVFVLDAASLKPLKNLPVHLEDVTEEYRAAIGIH